MAREENSVVDAIATSNSKLPRVFIHNQDCDTAPKQEACVAVNDPHTASEHPLDNSKTPGKLCEPNGRDPQVAGAHNHVKHDNAVKLPLGAEVKSTEHENADNIVVQGNIPTTSAGESIQLNGKKQEKGGHQTEDRKITVTFSTPVSAKDKTCQRRKPTKVLYATTTCNHCSTAISQTHYYHCCQCDDNFDMCTSCFQTGKRCLDITHESLELLVESRLSRAEVICKPENWEQLFEYRVTHDIFGNYNVVDATTFNVAKEQAADLGMVLQRREDSPNVKIMLFSAHIQRLLKATPAVGRMNVNVYSDYMAIEAPYEVFFHHLEDMKKRHQDTKDISVRENANFSALYQYFSTGPPSTAFTNVKQNLENRVISFNQLWALYKPDTLVFQQTLGHPEILRVHRKEQVTDMMGNQTAWDITVVQVSWDGRKEKFQRSLLTVRQQSFTMTRDINSLQLIPLEYLSTDERDELIQKVTKRGKKWAGYCRGKPTTKFYNGPAIPYLVNPQVPWGDSAPPEEEFISCRIIIDPGLVAKAKRHANLNTKHLTDKVVSGGDHTNDPLKAMLDLLGARRSSSNEQDFQPDPEYLLCPSTIPVFTLEEQDWMIVGVEDICDADWSKDAFERLVLSGEKKNHLKRLTAAHSKYKERRSNDLIKGKGKGLVMLFHGPPGVGKTLTAEALSEEVQLPLYRVNLGVVSSSRNWEPHLDHIFDCAYSWNAILLIDEAEVVLEERTFRGKDQNTWVSVFLRKLEYYQGILILTTNMIHSIDEAFRSRLSVAHEYKALDSEARAEIWQGIISRMDDKKVDKKNLVAQIPKWARLEFNARQIRNILTTAETAIFEDVTLLDAETVEIFIREVLSFAKLFKNKQEANRKRVLD